ncbi:MAG: tyrosine-type recombinase/integrase, partial [Mariprofundaceae bacterium]|nr:tyrosine-type recombinase/integrase [Mariprofundaceae bacterium]
EEFEHIKTLAPPEIRAAMDIAFLTGLRMGDILRLTHENIQEDGIHTPTSKSNRNMIYTWSDTLIAAVSYAQSINHGSTYLIANTKGDKYTESAFKSRWGKMMRKLAAERGIARFQFKDLRKKAGSDTAEDATSFLSHSSDAVTKAHYLVKPWTVKPTR